MSTTTGPIVTLLTDFGTRDVYVGVIKGVILARCGGAQIVDLAHEVEQGNVHEGGYLLASAWRYFPAGTVHCAVIDPGVGGDRRILAAEVAGHYFVAPDNGLLTELFNDTAPTRVVSVENESLMIQPVSQTFHGRDIFAPAAAALAGGVTLDELGPRTESWLKLPRVEPIEQGSELVGQVVHIDRFGNIITNIRADDLPDEPRVRIARHAIHGLADSYQSVPRGELLAIIGSTGRLEISINQGDAASLLAARVGDAVHVLTESE